MLFVGVDEAGYGPALGPLCVGLCAVRLRNTAFAAAAGGERAVTATPFGGSQIPELWEILRPTVGRVGENALFTVDDSKKIFSPHNRRAAENLARNVGAFLHLHRNRGHQAGAPIPWTRLLPAEDVLDLESDPWGNPPRAQSTPEAGASASESAPNDNETLRTLRKTLDKAAIELVELRVRALSARRYNFLLAECDDNKLRLVWRVMAEELAAIVKKAPPKENLLLVCDKLSGQKRYAPLLAGLQPGAHFWVERETAARSGYRAGIANGKCLSIQFLKNADSLSFPTALASMAAKWVREECMARLNAFFSTRQPALKPTSGYRNPVDAPAFLAATRVLRERLGISDTAFIRRK